MRVVSLGSGSAGNAYLVEFRDEALLIDCGLNSKTLCERLETAGVPIERLCGILLTHAHSDHTQGLTVFLKRYPEIPVFANALTAEKVAVDRGLDDGAFCYFENGQPFALGSFEVRAFSIPHDSSDPVGYLVRDAEGEVYFHGTDIGTPLDSVGRELARADVAILESNHDPVMLFGSGRPKDLIQRIYGPRGHLSNDQAADLVRRFASPRLKRLALAHLSRACNVPHLAEGAMRTALTEMGRSDVRLQVLAQDQVIEV